jgi:O-antigen/teichoic acid export membrane protein
LAPLVAILYSGLMLVGLRIIIQRHVLSVATPFLLMTIAATTCVLVLSFIVKPVFRDLKQGKSIIREHWRYGRWALGAQALTWVPTSAFIWGAGAWRSMSEAGELRALFNLAQPLQQMLSALQLILLPHAARTLSAKGWAAVKRSIWSITALATALALAYWGVFLAAAPFAVHMLYSGKYLNLTYLIPPMALASLTWSFCVGPIIGFRVCGRPSQVFAVNIVMNGAAVLLGLPLLFLYGPFDAMASLAVSGMCSALLALFLLRKYDRARPAGSFDLVSGTE